MSREGYLLEVKDLKKTFPLKRSFQRSKRGSVKALNGVSFHIDRGETLGLVGESGCGKTTCAQLILRLLEPTAGSLHFEGHDLIEPQGKKLEKLRSKIQMVFQDPYSSLNPRKRVRDIVGDPLLFHGVAGERDVVEKVGDLLEQVGLGRNQVDRYPHELSGGQRQRVAIARALAPKPELLVCDEPVSSLDVSVGAQVINLLREMGDALNLAMLFISHDLHVVRHVSDRIAVMQSGKIVETGEVEEIFSRPHHPYTRLLLDAAGSTITSSIIS